MQDILRPPLGDEIKDVYFCLFLSCIFWIKQMNVLLPPLEKKFNLKIILNIKNTAPVWRRAGVVSSAPQSVELRRLWAAPSLWSIFGARDSAGARTHDAMAALAKGRREFPVWGPKLKPFLKRQKNRTVLSPPFCFSGILRKPPE